jgi:hypothetical protein
MKFKIKSRLKLETVMNGDNQKALAIATNTDDGALSRMLSPRCEDAFPVHKMPAQVREQGPGLMEYLAIQCGGVYHHGEAEHHLHGTPGRLCGLLAKETGVTIQQLVQHMEDRVWSEDERQSDIPHLRKLISIASTLLKDAEMGVQP